MLLLVRSEEHLSKVKCCECGCGQTTSSLICVFHVPRRRAETTASHGTDLRKMWAQQPVEVPMVDGCPQPQVMQCLVNCDWPY